MRKNNSNNANSGGPAQAPPSYTLRQYACLTLSIADRFRLIGFPSEMIGVIRQAISSNWRRGIQKEGTYAGAYEFKLHGYPWMNQGSDSAESCLMMMAVLSALHHQGWYFVSSVDITKNDVEKDTLVFVYGTPPQATSFFAVSFNDEDKLHLIGAPSEVISATRQSLGAQEIQREEWLYSNTVYQFKLRGYPWVCSGEESVTSRMKFLALLDNFAALGWQLHASIDMRLGRERRDIDTLYFSSNHSMTTAHRNADVNSFC